MSVVFRSKHQKAMKKRINSAYLKLTILLKKYKRVRVVIQQYDYYNDQFYKDLRKRTLYADGRSLVSYKGDSYNNWSGFIKSCFMEDIKKPSLKVLLKEMKKHDSLYLIPVEVQYGWFYLKKETL
jgi:hypothetical protein